MKTQNKDYYNILGISKDATQEDISKAYKKLAMKYHPDRQVNKPEADKKDAEEKFKTISEAYEILGNKEKRTQYDAMRNGGQSFHGFGNFQNVDDIFNFATNFNFANNSGFANPFGFKNNANFNQQKNGADLQIHLDISFKEAIFGIIKEFDIMVDNVCPNCKGTGAEDNNSYVVCDQCNGTGTLTQQHGFFQISSTCPKCGGQGHIVIKCCKTCNGEKTVKQSVRIKLKIPAGINNGSKLRIAGSGQAGINGGKNGDLYCIIGVKKSDIFTRNNLDLITTSYISPITASLGGEVEVYTPYEIVKIKIPVGTTSGKQFRVQRKGIKTADKIGDLYVNIIIEPLVNLTKKQKSILDELNKTLVLDNLQQTQMHNKQIKKEFN